MRARFSLASLLLGLLSCSAMSIGACGKGDPASSTPVRSLVGHPKNGELPPDFICPGAPACPVGGDSTLYAAVDVEDITPPITEKLIKSHNDHPWSYSATAGDTFTDTNGNGVFDGTWMGGFDAGRAAQDVGDNTSVRVVLLKQGNTTIALVAIDVVGFFYDELVRIRDAVTAAKLPVSYVMFSSIHTHQTRDVVGIWGPDSATSGIDKGYNTAIRNAAVTGIQKAVANLKPAKATFGHIKVDGHIAGTDPLHIQEKALVGDNRDPVIIDTRMNTLLLTSAADGSTIATLVNFGSHPDAADDRNLHLSADWVHTMREGVEKGLDMGSIKVPGKGGVAVFFQGACGGQIGAGSVRVADPAGTEYLRPSDAQPDIGLLRTYQLGKNYAVYALASLQADASPKTYDTLQLGVRARQIYARVDNVGYHVGIVSHLFDRKPYHFDPSQPIGDGNKPDLLTEVAVIDIGPASLITIPGELYPESAVGGYDGSWTPPPFVLVQPTNPNPPNLAKAAKSGYLHNLSDATYKWTLSLANDEVGYITPAYDFVLDPVAPYLNEAPGDHYEETNSLGPMVESDVLDPLRELLQSKTPITRP
jgi:hypothetical protein